MSLSNELDVIDVCTIMPGRMSSRLPEVSWPAMGDSEKNCCCIMGSTDAATEFVDNATFRRTLSAIQSLRREKRVSSTYTVSEIRCDVLQEQFQYLESTKRGVTANGLPDVSLQGQTASTNKMLTRSRMTWLVT